MYLITGFKKAVMMKKAYGELSQPERRELSPNVSVTIVKIVDFSAEYTDSEVFSETARSESTTHLKFLNT